ncbi:MAG: MBL fold metallo-hydrolase [Lachnospiraceae bacterium]|nr:MBL fold metallo-hydrolase [Lachnospiraceae bacterium]
MRLCPIASGSSGNSIYVGSDTTHILIDAGISGKRICEGLNSLDLSPNDISGLLITHEHSDHIQSIGVMARKYGIPIYATEGTVSAVKNMKSCGEIDDSLITIVRADHKFTIGDIVVNPVRISHDAAEPVAYTLESEHRKASVITDLGIYNDYIINALEGSNVILAESNHDVRMLQVGPYPYYLKQRILSDHGHLSNENCGRMLSRVLHDGVKEIILGHLSKENNIPELAYEAVRLEIEAGDTPYKGSDFPIRVAKRDCPIAPVEF